MTTNMLLRTERIQAWSKKEDKIENMETNKKNAEFSRFFFWYFFCYFFAEPQEAQCADSLIDPYFLL